MSDKQSSFFDRNMRVSVNRAFLCEQNPQKVQDEKTDCVVSFSAGVVRVVKLQVPGENNTNINYVIDVEPKPLENNLAHAEIFATPSYATKSTFRRLCEKLARLHDEGEAQLLIPPLEMR